MKDDNKKKKNSIEPIEGWFELYSYKFEIYLGSVSRYILNKNLKDLPYIG